MTVQILSVKDVQSIVLDKNQKIIPSSKIIGQDRALSALKFGLSLTGPYNHIFCVGPKGVGRTTLTLKTVRSFAKMTATPSDWVYVANFKNFSEPKTLVFPATKGWAFSQRMSQEIKTLKQELKRAFSAQDYQLKIQSITQMAEEQKKNYLENLNQNFLTQNVALVQTEKGLGLTPVYRDKILNEQEFNALPMKVRKTLLPKLEKARQKLIVALQQCPHVEEIHRQKKEELDFSLFNQIIQQHWKTLLSDFPKIQGLSDYLQQAKEFLLSHLPILLHTGTDRIWKQLLVNPFVCHQSSDRAPVISMDLPSLAGLLGRIQKTTKLCEGFSPHMALQPGALHQANGGFLILDAGEVLAQKEVWQTLKKTLFTQKIVMESPVDGQSLYPVRSVLPEGIPLNLKVILIGSMDVYHEFKSKFEDFDELFKIRAEFTDQMSRTVMGQKAYVGEIAQFIQQNHLLPLTPMAYQLVLSYAGQITGDAGHLSLYVAKIHDLVRAADLLSRRSKKTKIDEKQIIQALEQKDMWENRAQTEWLESVKRGLIRCCVRGTQVGRVNTLSVCVSGQKRFGRLGAFNATVYAGSGDIVDIERQTSFGGPNHTKGMLILSAYLSGKFGQTEPLKLNASLGFEQSYGPIDGDSASAAELCALMSAIGKIPLQQNYAVTGAVNQFGEIQAVGGVNDKIKGCVDIARICQTSIGIIIPKVCVSELVLDPQVLGAIQNKKIRIYAVETIDECMEILSGQKIKAVHEKITTAWHQAYLNSKK